MIRVYTKYDQIAESIKVPYIRPMTIEVGDAFDWEYANFEWGVTEHFINRIEDGLEGVMFVHYN